MTLTDAEIDEVVDWQLGKKRGVYATRDIVQLMPEHSCIGMTENCQFDLLRDAARWPNPIFRDDLGPDDLTGP